MEPLKLLIFKVVVGVEGCTQEEGIRLTREVQDAVKSKEIPGYVIQHYVLPDYDSTKLDINLLYPPAAAFLSEKELLDLLVSKGEVPQEVLDLIKKEINTHNE